ncbi:hypothetical protein EWM64_g9211, partial [Hericium alpestre]
MSSILRHRPSELWWSRHLTQTRNRIPPAHAPVFPNSETLHHVLTCNRPTSPERTAELVESLAEIRARVQAHAAPGKTPTLVAVSKYKPAADILACYDAGQRDFGENYVQELVDKAAQLPADIRWHFIGTLQSNKCKILVSIPNIHAIQSVTSAKAASALDKALPPTRTEPLRIFLQVNTSGEEAKSGLPPPTAANAA